MGLVRSCRVAFPLGLVCGLIFSLVCAFRGVGCVLVWVLVALRLVGRLNGFRLCAWLLVRVPLRDAERERERGGRREGGEGMPHPYFVRVLFLGALPHPSNFKKII